MNRLLSHKGFTLVELAIVMTIIGLLIGGVIKGQQLIDNARITATIGQVRSYESALTTFRDTYGQLPGDMANARARLPGCTAANGCYNGNGDSIVGVDSGLSWGSIDGSVPSENTQFWKHLAMTNMISGVVPAATAPAWGETHPAAKFDGGFHVRYTRTQNAAAINGSMMDGLIVVLRSDINGSWSGCANTTSWICPVSPAKASVIDRKMDDGQANMGFVHAVSNSHRHGCGHPNQGVQGPNGYDETQTGKRCDMMFRLQ